MKSISKPMLALCPLIVFLTPSCDSRRGEPRAEQLERTAENLEAKAEKVRVDVKESAGEKIAEAKEIRKTTGDEDTAGFLEKDASVTREAGELRAEQLEKQAEKVRGQKE